MTEQELVKGVAATIRERSAFVVRRAPELARFRRHLSMRTEPLIKPRGKSFGETPKTIGAHFLIGYGQKALHNKTHLVPGSALVIAASSQDNGAFGFFEFDQLLEPPFITTTSSGTPGEARVQEWPCGVADDCLILTPRDGTPREYFYIAAAKIQSEQWRFNYGMKMTPERIAEYPIEVSAERLKWIREYLAHADTVEKGALDVAEDEYDRELAERRLAEIKATPGKTIRGNDLAKRLEALL
jgi:hypothetical protein